jgi:AraC-like DNA-binding protein
VKRYSLYTKMILFGCMLCALPVLVLGLFSYLKSSESIERQVNNGNVQILKQMKGNFEQVLKTLDHSLNNVTSSTLMQELLYRPFTYEDFQTYNNLRKELSLLQSFDTKVTDVIVFNSANQWVMNNRGLYTFEQFEQAATLESYMKLPLNSNWIVRENNQLGSLDTESYGCKYTVSLVKKMPLFDVQKRGLAFAHIPVCSLAELLDETTDAKKVMVLDQNYQILVHPNAEMVGTTVWDAGYIPRGTLKQFTGKSGQFHSDSRTGDVSVTYEKSDFNGWIYLSISDISAVTKESRSIGWFTAYVCLVLLALSLFTVYFGSRRMYSPIQNILASIRERLPELQAKKQTDFQLIGEHIDDLFRSNTSMKHELQQSSEQIRKYFMTKLYQGNVKTAEIEEYLKLYGYWDQVNQWDQMAVLVMQIDVIESTRYDTKDLDLLLFAVNNIVEELIPAANRLAPVITDQSQVTLFGCYGMDKESFNKQIFELTEVIQKTIQSFLQLHVSIGISLPFRSLKLTSRAYKEGLEALKQRLKLGEGVIVSYSGINSGKHSYIYPFPKQLKNELIDAIKLADEEKAVEILKNLMDEILHEDRSPHDYQIALFRLLNELMVSMQESGITLQHLGTPEVSLHEELTKLYVRAEIENWYKFRLITPLIHEFRDRRESQYHNLSGQLIDMIQQHYDNDLTLEECASKLHYNAFYLSSVFKKETNMTFSEYLSMYRFKMAKEWLVETEMPVKDIAQKLCYNNPQNFIRSFRKQEGMTPGQYRTMYGGKEEI